MKKVCLALFLIMGLLQIPSLASGAVCDRKVSAPANLQDEFRKAGVGATICLSGTFKTKTEIRPLAHQTIIDGVLKYVGTYNVTLARNNRLVDGLDLHAGGITVKNMEIANFEGRAIVCGNHATILANYLHNNRQNAIACIAQNEDWHLYIRNNIMTENGWPTLEYVSAGAVKLMELSKPGHCLGCGATILNNVASDNIGNGIWLDRSSSATIIGDNVTNHNTHKGIRCEKCGGPVLISGNVSRSNNHENISVVNSALVTLENNSTNDGGHHGLFITWKSVSTKTYPTLTPTSAGFKGKQILVKNKSMYKDGIVGCDLSHVMCS